ncbi:MAG: hypothetical protein ACLFQ8_02485 [Candidatus Aenigmatarchaeota archaeon]
MTDKTSIEASGITGRIIESPGMFIFGAVAVVILLICDGYRMKIRNRRPH